MTRGTDREWADAARLAASVMAPGRARARRRAERWTAATVALLALLCLAPLIVVSVRQAW